MNNIANNGVIVISLQKNKHTWHYKQAARLRSLHWYHRH